MINYLLLTLIVVMFLPRGLRLGAAVVIFAVVAGVNSVMPGVN